MATIVRWSPYREMVSLRDAMDQMLEENFNRLLGDGPTSADISLSLPLDMYEKDGKYVVRTPMPGLKAEDIDIQISDNNILNIKGEFKCEEDEQECENMYFQELRYGKFQRAIRLPENVDAENVEASFDEGILKLTLPKSESAKTRQIPVKAGSKG
ncbi:MAG: Hsp20/alpha crystallin family protein [Chloroflexota bacterium]